MHGSRTDRRAIQLLLGEAEGVVGDGAGVELARKDGLAAHFVAVVALDEDVASELQPSPPLSGYVHGELRDVVRHVVDTCSVNCRQILITVIVSR